MKIQAIKDKNGKVIATYHKSTSQGLSVEPVLEPGHAVSEMEVADDFHENLKAFYEQHG
jgi:hypothetical protein